VAKSKEVKHKEAEERLVEYRKLTLNARLARAIDRGHAGTKEVKRLKREAVANGQ